MNSEPVDLIIYKVSQRCNLDCTYCYVFNMGDDSWLDRPALSSKRVSAELGRKIRSHCIKHSKRDITVELHGGEPLLLGKRRFREQIAEIRLGAAPVNVSFCLQTNGLLLDQEWLELFEHEKIPFSVSLDGPPSVGDKNRIYPNSSGSTLDLLKKILQLKSASLLYDKLCQGYLCVIDPTSDGGEVYQWFVNSGFYKFDFLVPDGNFVESSISAENMYLLEEFLISAFDQWYASVGEAPRVRFFEHAVSSILGGQNTLDSFGADISSICVLESDGELGTHDVLRICDQKNKPEPLNIFDHELSDLQRAFDYQEVQKLASKCLNCDNLKSCGGGYLPHRFDGESFQNPSYYCEPLNNFFDHVRRKIGSSIQSSNPATAAISTH